VLHLWFLDFNSFGDSLHADHIPPFFVFHLHFRFQFPIILATLLVPSSFCFLSFLRRSYPCGRGECPRRRFLNWVGDPLMVE
jgi:hypothetical protein